MFNIFVPDSTIPENSQDPFLDLVIASEYTNDHETLMKVAQAAAASSSEVPVKPKLNLQILEQFTMTKVPVEEPVTIVKKQYFVESSDNDFGGNNNTHLRSLCFRLNSN